MYFYSTSSFSHTHSSVFDDEWTMQEKKEKKKKRKKEKKERKRIVYYWSSFLSISGKLISPPSLLIDTV